MPDPYVRLVTVVTEFFGDWMGREVAASDQRRNEYAELRSEDNRPRRTSPRWRDLTLADMVDAAAGNDRLKRQLARLQTRAGIYFAASSTGGAALMLEAVRGELNGVPILGPIASLPVPTAAPASQIVNRWRLNVPPGYRRKTSDETYRRHVGHVPLDQMDSCEEFFLYVRPPT